MTEDNEYNPDYAIHPGEILRDELAEMPKKKLFTIPGLTVFELFLLMTEKRKVYGMEAKLAEITGTSEELWSNLQKKFDEWKERQKDER